MKFSQDNILKLGFGGVGGYFLADYLLPKRGFAKGGGCGNPNFCFPGDGKSYSCCHIPGDLVDACQGQCNQGGSDPWNNMNWISEQEAKKNQRYPGGIGGTASNDIRRGVVSAANPPGGIGGDIGKALGGLPGTIFGIATPIVLIGGLAALILLTRR